MNIFALDLYPKKAAQAHIDKHVVKMVLETAQILSTALRNNGYSEDDIYRKTHDSHPCVLWAGTTRENFNWLCELGLELGLEYTYRYEKTHKSVDVIKKCRALNTHIPKGDFTDFALVMPEKYKSFYGSVSNYRRYYIEEKEKIASWKKRGRPEWWEKNKDTLF